ncbi:MAG TPA: hypothetical protein VK203_13420 [Nostocaceae cyanobacterium]|nr:hypothetical protein [Nostocaceae cyanobacterium]
MYLNPTELQEILQQGYQVALKRAALEVKELIAMVREEEIINQALQLIQQ